MNLPLFLYVLLGLTSMILLYGLFNTFGNINEPVPFKEAFYRVILPFIVFVIVSYGLLSSLKKATSKGTKIESQLERINSIEKSLKEVYDYLQNQKTEIKNREVQIDKANQLLMELKEKQEALKSVSVIDKEELKNILLAQKLINQKYNKTEKASNIMIGVISSLLATSIIIVIRYLVKRWLPNLRNRTNK
jgi:hypothetical protein